MTKLFNFIIFLAIVYLFFNISVSQFEKFTEIQKKGKVPHSLTAPSAKFLCRSTGEFVDHIEDCLINHIGRDDNIPLLNTIKINKRKDAIVEDDHYDQDKVVNIDSIDSEINASDIISDIEGRSASDKSCGYPLSATITDAETDCDSKTINNSNVNTPAKEIFKKITEENNGMPQTIKDIYNKMVTPEKGGSNNIKTQGNHTMNIDSNKYTTIKGQEKIVTQLTKSLHANDPNYDSYSVF